MGWALAVIESKRHGSRLRAARPPARIGKALISAFLAAALSALIGLAVAHRHAFGVGWIAVLGMATAMGAALALTEEEPVSPQRAQWLLPLVALLPIAPIAFVRQGQMGGLAAGTWIVGVLGGTGALELRKRPTAGRRPPAGGSAARQRAGQQLQPVICTRDDLKAFLQGREAAAHDAREETTWTTLAAGQPVVVGVSVRRGHVFYLLDAERGGEEFLAEDRNAVGEVRSRAGRRLYDLLVTEYGAQPGQKLSVTEGTA
ncbi:MAG TPA: hypothetical protein VFB34_00335 [Chloroflexota bacterium]|nr:hypothetical protein [Chloroflexota bacterium]